ncbi:MAG: Maf family nucleotide pyrophosphatase, partial [Cyclobacteriaceae bacterium]|nr:Maf family nucleotide pyrophosphatase [Cyclobacteriaceae bacterium]
MNPETRLVLASNSPRRQQLLKDAGFLFHAEAKPFPENYPAQMDKENVAQYLAGEKNRFHRTVFPTDILITADTTVILDNHLLEKPENEREAYQMLMKLSGKTHQVITGVCISSRQKTISFAETTLVEFRQLSDEEINHYIGTYRPYDKAGAYGIQEWIGLVGINKIQGSYHNVVGLP